MARLRKNRRGVVILVVLSLLVLFTVLAVTFVIVAGQYRTTAEAVATAETLGVSPVKDLDKAFYQLLRDTNARSSSARFHSLLRDFYGEDGFRGRLVQSPAEQSLILPATGGQLIRLSLTPGTVPSTDGYNYRLNRTLGYYNGCVLSITSGPARGLSTRIVDYRYIEAGAPPQNYTVDVARFTILPPKGDGGATASVADLIGENFIVNGRPFNGAGFGYNRPSGSTTQGNLNNTVTIPGANTTAIASLAPNHAARPFQPTLAAAQNDYRNLLSGGSDEGYDAPDNQNVVLALVPAGATASSDIIPTFHRPALINYWINQGSWPPNPPALADHFTPLANFKRNVSMRPFEPNFDGSNLNYFETGFDPSGNVIAQWDVDNDGDGIADSIWVDLGLPIQTSKDGRKYKPLFAILCQDMDGRLNVNAHGRIATVNPPAVNVAGGVTTAAFAKGLGYGPPEVRLDLVPNLTGNLTGMLMARYGLDSAPGGPGFDLLAALGCQQEPANYFYRNGIRTSYSSPPDIRAELRFALNTRGQPAFEQFPNAPGDTRQDSPYELNLNDPQGNDTPFTVAELERVLRRFDADTTTLPDRLANYITNLQSDHTNSRILTTASFDPPMPSVTAPTELAYKIGERLDPSTATANDELFTTGHFLAPGSFLDLFVARLIDADPTNMDPTTPAGRLAINQAIEDMVPRDLRMGLRFDLNRMIGDALDSNANWICDEPGEEAQDRVFKNFPRPEFSIPVGSNNGVPMWHTNGKDMNGDNAINAADHVFARQLFARHLYVLMMTVMDQGGNTPDPAVAQQVAQWAVNVVDFRDADSIMTYFEYDENPFNGWTTDGDLTTTADPEREVVWGSERPELLLTEGMAFHARRTKDTANDTGGTNHLLSSAPPNQDTDYDQDKPPFATALVEVYNPWNGTDTTITAPRELYVPFDDDNDPSTPPVFGIDLNRMTPNGSPVWRLLVVNQASAPTIVGNTYETDLDPTTVAADQAVYFVNNTAGMPAAGPVNGLRQYYTNQAVPPILGGRFGVIGGGFFSGGSWVSPVGELDPNANANDGRRVVLTPKLNPNAPDQVAVYQGGGAAPEKPSGAAVAIVPNLSRIDPNSRLQTAFSVSEPTSGYPVFSGQAQFNATANPNPPYFYAYNGVYEDANNPDPNNPLAIDTPLDKDIGYTMQVGNSDGTQRAFCRVYLQRLANPLIDYNLAVNPYRTIDSMPIDLTVFNGREAYPNNGADPDVQNVQFVDFSCLQRGEADNVTLPEEARRLWTQESVRAAMAADSATEANPIHYFPFTFTHTLGGINSKYLGPVDLTNPTFPWLVWNNRPFISPYELLNVPRERSSELLKAFTLPSGATPYDGVLPEYAHLVNFFHSDSSTNATGHLYRIFDYVHIPSRFAGTTQYLNPGWFSNPATATGFMPPFNKISSYRDPGRVNVNTISSEAVWDAVRGGYGPTFSQLVLSRQSLTLNSATPTYFHSPFRNAGGPLPPTVSSMEDIDPTFLRSLSVSGGLRLPLMEQSIPSTVARHPRNSFFRYELLNRLGTMATTRSNVYALWITVGYFEVEPNFVPGQGMVVDGFHPEGYRVAQEIGIDTGEIRRHRAFYMVDRTIPVAFQPGENHNVDKCVLLRRFID